MPTGPEKDDMELKGVLPNNLDPSFPKAFAEGVFRGTGVEVGGLTGPHRCACIHVLCFVSVFPWGLSVGG